MRDLPRGKRVQGAGTDAIRTLADPGEGIFPDAESSRRRQTGIRPDTEPEQYVVSDNAETKRGAARKKSEKEGENEPCAHFSPLFLIFSGINYLYRMFMYFIWFL